MENLPMPKSTSQGDSCRCGEGLPFPQQMEPSRKNTGETPGPVPLPLAQLRAIAKTTIVETLPANQLANSGGDLPIPKLVGEPVKSTIKAPIPLPLERLNELAKTNTVQDSETVQ